MSAFQLVVAGGNGFDLASGMVVGKGGNGSGNFPAIVAAEVTESQVARFSMRDIVRFGLKLGKLVKQGLAFACQQRAGLRGREVPPATFKQRAAEIRLERTNLLRYGRLRDMVRCGRFCEAAKPHHRAKITELP